jgi:hypothetical protein
VQVWKFVHPWSMSSCICTLLSCHKSLHRVRIHGNSLQANLIIQTLHLTIVIDCHRNTLLTTIFLLRVYRFALMPSLSNSKPYTLSVTTVSVWITGIWLASRLIFFSLAFLPISHKLLCLDIVGTSSKYSVSPCITSPSPKTSDCDMITFRPHTARIGIK